MSVRHYNAWRLLRDRYATMVCSWLWAGVDDGDLIAKYVLRWRKADQRMMDAIK